MKVIAVVAQKGGVGKTATAAAIISYLSSIRKRVLAIDLNDQGDLSDTLGAKATPSGALAVLTGAKIADKAVDANLVGVDVLTGAEELAMMENLIRVNGRERATILREAIRPLRRYYQYCIIDAPGSFNTGMLAALACADYVVIPSHADFYSLRGIKRLVDNIKTVQQDINPELQVAGILLTRFQGRRNLSRDAVDALQGAEKMLGVKLFNTRIRDNTKIAEAPGHHKTILDYAPGSIGAEDYRAFMQELFQIIGGNKDDGNEK